MQQWGLEKCYWAKYPVLFLDLSILFLFFFFLRSFMGLVLIYSIQIFFFNLWIKMFIWVFFFKKKLSIFFKIDFNWLHTLFPFVHITICQLDILINDLFNSFYLLFFIFVLCLDWILLSWWWEVVGCRIHAQRYPCYPISLF